MRVRKSGTTRDFLAFSYFVLFLIVPCAHVHNLFLRQSASSTEVPHEMAKQTTQPLVLSFAKISSAKFLGGRKCILLRCSCQTIIEFLNLVFVSLA